ncbi:hypothetical protein EDB87DRAFT_1569203 [Lactarius vividus]|nr:hypothetical protein EDB87DRAFT_1569203 [Lactarius vividus]
MSSYSSDASRSGARSPLFGTATFSTFTRSGSSPTRYSYSSRSGNYRNSSNDSDISGGDMRRITVSPSPSNRRSGSDLYSYSEEDSIRDAAEVEAALSALDEELDQTEDALTEWSRGSSVTPSSYLSDSVSSPSFTATTSSYIPFTNTLRDGRILSTITERTENPSSRPTSHNLSVPGSRPVSDAIRRSGISVHSRGLTEPGPSANTPSRRTGDLIAFFEDKSTSDTSSRSYSPFGHRRTGSVPAGPRSPSPYTQTSQSIPTFGSTTYGYGSSAGSRPSSPSKSWISQSQSYTSSGPSGSFLSPPPQSSTMALDSGFESYQTSSTTPTHSNTFTSTSYTATDTDTTPQGTSLKRPQASPRSPLSSVRNVVAAWKSRSPSFDESSRVSSNKSSTEVTPDEGFFSVRRRVERGSQRERAAMGGESGSSTFRTSDSLHSQGDVNVPSTPRTSTSFVSSVVPPPFDLAELGTFAKGNQEVSCHGHVITSVPTMIYWSLLACVVSLCLWTNPFLYQPLRIGLLWYLNVHAPPPYRWQRCQAILYPHMLVLSWIAQGGGRGIVTLDLLNCTEVRSVASPTHPSAQDDVGTIAARTQTANAQAEGFGDLSLMETLCPFQLFYSDGVERLGAESARERVRWVSAIW